MLEKREPSYTVDAKVNRIATMKNSTAINQKIKKEVFYNPAILYLGIYLKNTKTLIQEDIFTPTVTATSFK